VVITDSAWETMFSNVINQPIGPTTKFNTIAKIRKYRGLPEGHHFISMTMEMHSAPWHDMDHFIKEGARLSTIDD